MDDATARALNAINRRFYAEHAEAFATTREGPWEGWRRALAASLARAGTLRVLDVGCGNGRLAAWLASGRRGALETTGVDASAPLLARARERVLPEVKATWHEADFVESPAATALPAGPFDAIALFGVLHGVPGCERRRALVAACAERLAPGGDLVLTAWRFGELPRFRDRIVPWGERAAGLALEPGDHLLRWGPESGDAVRYCHALDGEAFAALTDGLGLEPRDAFLADGREGDLNRYAVFRAPAGRCRLDGRG